MKASHQKGFTIVELLIVVVVIAILSTIAVVSYNGVTAQAKTAKQVTTIENLQKALLNGITQGFTIPSNSNPICLGRATDYPAQDGFAQGVCMTAAISGGSTVNVMYTASDYATWTNNSMPSAQMPVTKSTYTYGGVTYAYTARGAWLIGGVVYEPGSKIGMYWVPQQGGKCGMGQSSSGQALCVVETDL